MLSIYKLHIKLEYAKDIFMKTLILITVVLFIFSSNAYALKISYTAGECLNPADDTITQTTSNQIESVYYLSEDQGNGFYNLELHGGLPSIVNSSDDICIEHETNIGYRLFFDAHGFPPPPIQLPTPIDKILATAYFDEKKLIIFSNSIYTDLAGNFDSSTDSLATSRFFPVSNTVFFDYIAESNAFKLTKIIRSKGLIQASASHSPLYHTYVESVDPSPNGTNIMIPKMDIIYKLEN